MTQLFLTLLIEFNPALVRQASRVRFSAPYHSCFSHLFIYCHYLAAKLSCLGVYGGSHDLSDRYLTNLG